MPPIPVVAAVIAYGGLALLGLRSYKVESPGLWCCPGGKADHAGTMRDNVAREVHEEIGVKLPPDRFQELGFCREWIDPVSGQSYPTFYYGAALTPAEAYSARNMEPEKFSVWSFVAPRALPVSMFPGERQAVTTFLYA